MSAIKLGVIGGGSATFALGLVKDICLRENLAGSLVALMDVDRERVRTMRTFAKRYADELGADVRFTATTDREAALKDADFVINTAQVGGHPGVERIRRFCADRGYYRGAAAYRCLQVRMMVAVARDMERFCPDAWLIQASNPLPEGCTAMTRETPVKVCGLCHGHFGYKDIARVLGLDADKVRARAIGLNHCIFLTHFQYEGQDAYPLIDEWIASKAEAFWKSHRPRFHDNQMSRAAVEQYRMYGLFPIGDTPRAGGWWFHTDLETKKRWYGEVGGFDSEIGWGQYLEGLDEKVAGIRAAAEDPSARLTELFPPKQTHEQHFPLIDALANDRPVELQVNVPNRGAIEGIPDDVVVEVPAACSGRGIQPHQAGSLPDPVMLNVIWPRILHMERLVSLSLRPDRRMLLYMILDDHRTGSWDQAVTFCQDLMALPEFAEMARQMEQGASGCGRA